MADFISTTETEYFDFDNQQQQNQPSNLFQNYDEISKNDFKIIKTLGEGSFGKVSLVEKDGFKYALKEVNKEFIVKHEKT